MMQDIIIPKGVRVQRDDNEVITLSGDVYVEAERQEDGGFIYTVGAHQYYTCAGVCSFFNHLVGKYHEAIPHGLTEKEPAWRKVDEHPAFHS